MNVLFISPQTQDKSKELTEQHELKFDLLSDAGNAVAKKYSLVYTVPEFARDSYMKLNLDIPAHNADGSWDLPVTASYVIDTGGKIIFAEVVVDHTHRALPSAILQVIREAG